MATTMPSVGRVCGECRSCCEGCSIYADRPESPCRVFVCGLLMTDSPLPEAYRPDQLGVIFVPIFGETGVLGFGFQRARIRIKKLMAQMRNHTQLTGEPHLVKKPVRLLCYGLPEFQQDMVSKSHRGESLW